ncbi:MAG: undecaprenyl-diphosphate phosphatase [Bacteroidetes bacterium]|nr:undecaprenyl-diphosphate phosphatase [Bacteroidota bacterium]
MSWLQAIILAIVEGITEFLPISSTGHMAIAASVLGIEKDAFTKLFIENIQFGTILSVIILYWRKFLNFKELSFYIKLIVAFIPAAIIGVLFKEHIDSILGNPMFIASVMFVGGVILLFVDNWFKNPTIESEQKLSYGNAFIIGLFQILSVIFPGISRSAATIVGGMQQKMTRKAAAEFSFFLAVPTLAGAFVLSLWDAYKHTPELLTARNFEILTLGNIVGFAIAIVAIRTFISFLQKHGFRAFGWYRIVVGLTLIILLLMGVSLSVV